MLASPAAADVETGKQNTVPVGRKSQQIPQDDHEEYQYLKLIRRILDVGNVKGDRTGNNRKELFYIYFKFCIIPIQMSKVLLHISHQIQSMKYHRLLNV